MTECTPQIDLFSIGRRTVTASFLDTPLTSDIGAVLLGRIDRRHRITERVAEALLDSREAAKVQHSTADLLRQRVYQIACGYEDTTDATTLRHDPGFQLALNRVPHPEATLASQPTLSRFEVRRQRELIAFSNVLSVTFGSSGCGRRRAARSGDCRSRSISTQPTSLRTANSNSPSSTATMASTFTTRFSCSIRTAGLSLPSCGPVAHDRVE
jgi:Transposase DDE domain group 1